MATGVSDGEEQICQELVNVEQNTVSKAGRFSLTMLE